MKTIRGLLMLVSTVVLVGACGPGTVTVRDHRPPPPPDPGPGPTPNPGDAFDSTGWTSASKPIAQRRSEMTCATSPVEPARVAYTTNAFFVTVFVTVAPPEQRP